LVAVIVEPIVQGAAGVVVHPRGFLQGIKSLCEQYDCLLIADEVAVGMGRTGTMFACEHEQVSPDFLCLGKGLTGGYLPMSATLTSSRIWNAFLGRHEDLRTFFHGHTYGGNPLCAAAAHATLELFEMEQTLSGIPLKQARMQRCLDRFKEHPEVGDVRSCGLMAAIELVQDKQTKTAHPWQQQRSGKVCKRILEKGVWLRPLGNVIPIIPPLSISEQEIDILMASIEYGLG
jgi:adenosylmethionine-8-amino-7-oxononanoate aminotransferase